MNDDATPKTAVTLLNAGVSEMSKVERLKLESEGLFWVAGKEKHSFRSELDAMAHGEAETLSNEAKEICKHFGIYKQQERVEGRKSHNYIFMVRLRAPAGGEFSPEQWRAVNEACERYGNGTLRLTTRQSIQFHHVKGANLGALVRFLNQDYPNTGYQISTLGGCGDVNRNTMCSVADDLVAARPMRSRELAFAIAKEMAPRSSAYYQIFLSDESGETMTPISSEEPIYGKHYMPRKFKVGIAHPDDNSTDLLTQDVGLIPVVHECEVEEYDLYAGGGMGSTHNNPETAPLLALYLGRIPRAQVVDAVRAIAILQKENGERKDRRMARWKYTIRRMGVRNVKQLLRERFHIELKDALPQPLPPNRFFHGWNEEVNGKLFLGIPVESGRLRDDERSRLRSAVLRIVEELRLGVRITGNQDLILTHIPREKRHWVEQELARSGAPSADRLARLRRQALACPALPTCGLAMTEAERVLPSYLRAVEEGGLGDVDVVVRMSGCPNGCSRPPTAEIGIVGFGKNATQILVGGARDGSRIARELYPKVGEEQLVPILIGLMRAIRDHNPGSLPAGDYLNETPFERLREIVGIGGDG